MNKKLIFGVLCLRSLFGAWDPACLGFSEEKLEILQRVERKAVVEFLKNSWCSEEKANLIMDLVLLTAPEVCVDVGVFTGSTFLPILTALKHLGHGFAYGIDAWSNAEAVKGIPSHDPNYAWWLSLDMGEIHGRFQQTIAKWSLFPYCQIIQDSSENAASQISSIDFLHLDGNFSENGSLLDVECYLPKLKSGGYVLLSNVFVVIDGHPAKMKTLWAIFDQCELVSEIENSNAILFRKN